MAGRHQMPARGALDGVRKDLQKAKGSDATGYNPKGVGNAYSHNFLNQKPWHPANFRNQAKVYEAEQKKIQEAKQKEIAKAEFQAEQEFLQTLSYLSPEEQQKFRERQGVQFLYMKPPGADSMPAAGPSNQGPAADTSAAEAAGPSGRPARAQQPYAAGKSHVGDMLGAVRALKQHDRWDFKHMSGMGTSPPRGSCEAGAPNQQMLMSSSEDELDGHRSREAGEKRSRSNKADLAEAEAILRQAGYDLEKLRGSAKKRKKEKRKKRSQEKQQ